MQWVQIAPVAHDEWGYDRFFCDLCNCAGDGYRWHCCNVDLCADCVPAPANLGAPFSQADPLYASRFRGERGFELSLEQSIRAEAKLISCFKKPEGAASSLIELMQLTQSNGETKYPQPLTLDLAKAVRADGLDARNPEDNFPGRWQPLCGEAIGDYR